jgi:hypothetical protein
MLGPSWISPTTLFRIQGQKGRVKMDPGVRRDDVALFVLAYRGHETRFSPAAAQDMIRTKLPATYLAGCANFPKLAK